MIAQIRSELLKQRSTRTLLGLFLAMVGLIALAEILHGLGLPADSLGDPERQLMVFGLGGMLSSLFAALLGAMSITAEIRHGTIRPTFLVTPRRGRVVAAKALVSVVLGAVFGLAGGAAATAVGALILRGRGVDVLVDRGDVTTLILGATVGAALWAGIGLGVGAIVRQQVPALVGICAWILFVEGLLSDATGGLGEVGRYLPGSAAAAIAGQGSDRLLAPAIAAALLIAYALVASAIGALTTVRRDVD